MISLSFLVVALVLNVNEAFQPASPSGKTISGIFHSEKTEFSGEVDERTGKPTGRSFLPRETIERAKNGSPVEKIKLGKDGTAAFVDIYDYAAKIRAGVMNWEDIEAADLDSVSCFSSYAYSSNLEFGAVFCQLCCTFL